MILNLIFILINIKKYFMNFLYKVSNVLLIKYVNKQNN